MTSETETPADKEEIGLKDQAGASPAPENVTNRATMQSPSRIGRHNCRLNHLLALSSQSGAESTCDTIPNSLPEEAGKSTPSSEAPSGSSSPPRLRRAGLNRHRNRPRQLSAATLLEIPQPSPSSRTAGIEEVSTPTLSRSNTAPVSQADFACIPASTISHPEDLIHIPTLVSDEAQLLPDINTINRINAEIVWGVPKSSPSPSPARLLSCPRASTWPTQDPAQRQDTAGRQDPRQTQDSQDHPSHDHTRQDSGDLGYCTCKAVMHCHATTVEEGRCVICKLHVSPPPPRYC